MINLWNIKSSDSVAAASALQPGDTLPAVFFGAVASRPDEVFMRCKKLGVWASMTWREAAVAVREAADGLRALGVEPGQVVCTVSHTRQECILADLAVLSVGAVSAAISPGLTIDMAELCGRMGAVLAFVEDDVQLASLLSAEGASPVGLKIVLFCDEALANDLSQSDGRRTSWDELRALGRKTSAATQATSDAAFDQMVAGMSPDAPAILSCSAGTTGVPHCAVHSHRAVLVTCRALQERVPYSKDDTKLCFLSWARVNERLLSVYLPILAGTRIGFTEGLDTVPENLREVAPNLLSATPSQLERLRGEVLGAVDEAGRIPRAAFEWALACGAEAAEQVIRCEAPGFWLRAKCVIGRIFILNNVRRFMGLDRCRHLIVVDATLRSALASWYLAMGVPLVQVWGNAETLGIAAVNALPDFKPGSVGKPLSVNRIEINTTTAELTVSGANVGGSGTIRTGDLGRIDAHGFLKIDGRTSDRMATASGDSIPASHIQHLLRESPYVQDVLVFGEGRPFPSAIILLAREKVEHHAHRIGISFPDFGGLTKAPEVRALLQVQVDRANEKLEAPHRIRDFHLIDTDLEPGDAEMTPTQMLRRWAIERRYCRQIDSMYTWGQASSSNE